LLFRCKVGERELEGLELLLLGKVPLLDKRLLGLLYGLDRVFDLLGYCLLHLVQRLNAVLELDPFPEVEYIGALEFCLRRLFFRHEVGQLEPQGLEV